jgi:hypothetical protein
VSGEGASGSKDEPEAPKVEKAQTSTVAKSDTELAKGHPNAARAQSAYPNATRGDVKFSDRVKAMARPKSEGFKPFKFVLVLASLAALAALVFLGFKFFGSLKFQKFEFANNDVSYTMSFYKGAEKVINQEGVDAQEGLKYVKDDVTLVSVVAPVEEDSCKQGEADQVAFRVKNKQSGKESPVFVGKVSDKPFIYATCVTDKDNKKHIAVTTSESGLSDISEFESDVKTIFASITVK